MNGKKTNIHELDGVHVGSSWRNRLGRTKYVSHFLIYEDGVTVAVLVSETGVRESVSTGWIKSKLTPITSLDEDGGPL